MTESTAPTASAAPPKVSFWEDLIDIYFSPAAVFQRRQNSSVWPPMLFVALSIGIIFFATFNTLSPIFEAEFTRNTAQALAKGGQNVPPEALARMRDIGLTVTRYGIAVIMLVTMFLIGVVAWIVGKLVGSQQTFHAALVVAAWANMPRVLGAVLGGVQGLLMDPEQLNSQLALSIGPARFFDADTTNPLLYQFLGRFDLITIWVTILLAVGLHVTGKVSKPKAALFGLLIWVVGGLYVLRAGYLAT